MRRGYIRATRRKSAASQIANLKAAKVRVFYEEAKGESWQDFAQSLRGGDEVVVDGFESIGANRVEGTARLQDIVNRGARLVDASTGFEADPAAVALWEEACRSWAGNARLPSRAEAVRRGKLGGRKPMIGNLSDVEAKEIWADLTIPKDEALAQIGLTERTAYRRLGERGAPPGRPKGAPKEPAIRQSKIYFCQAGGPQGPVKIGISMSIAGRLGSLKTGHHDDLKLLATINGSTKDEKALHRRFKQYHKRGEWFECGPELAAYIRSLPKSRQT